MGLDFVAGITRQGEVSRARIGGFEQQPKEPVLDAVDVEVIASQVGVDRAPAIDRLFDPVDHPRVAGAVDR